MSAMIIASRESAPGATREIFSSIFSCFLVSSSLVGALPCLRYIYRLLAQIDYISGGIRSDLSSLSQLLDSGGTIPS